MGRPLLAIVAAIATGCSLLLAGCSSPSGSVGDVAAINLHVPVISRSDLAGLGVPVRDIVDNRIQQSASFDDGAFVVSPPGKISPGFALSKAKVLVEEAMVNQQADYNPSMIALARVSISVPRTAGMPSYHQRLAWIGFLGGYSEPVSCGGGDGESYIYEPSFTSVIVDARTGTDPVTFQARGTGPCGGEVVGPFVHRAYEVLSVPWTFVGYEPSIYPRPPMPPPGMPSPAPVEKHWTAHYLMPPCGSQWDSGTVDVPHGTTKFFVEVEAPIKPPAHCPAVGPVTAQWGTSSERLGHAPTGVLLGTARL